MHSVDFMVEQCLANYRHPDDGHPVVWIKTVNEFIRLANQAKEGFSRSCEGDLYFDYKGVEFVFSPYELGVTV